jgi:hypothetical protein
MQREWYFDLRCRTHGSVVVVPAIAARLSNPAYGIVGYEPME